METAICANMGGQGQELDPEGSSESEMYARPPNKGGGIQVLPTPAMGMCKSVTLGVGLLEEICLNGKDP